MSENEQYNICQCSGTHLYDVEMYERRIIKMRRERKTDTVTSHSFDNIFLFGEKKDKDDYRFERLATKCDK